MMLVGYARCSTTDQDLSLQLDALNKAGCERTYSDRVSGAKTERPELTKALDHLRDGDTLVVWKLDRLGRSLQHLIETVKALEERGVGFRSITEQLDTTTNGGKLTFHIFGALAEFERGLIRERTMAGLKAARRRGRLGGRPKKLASSRQIERAQKMYGSKGPDGKAIHTTGEIAEALGISRATLYRYIGSSSSRAQ